MRIGAYQTYVRGRATPETPLDPLPPGSGRGHTLADEAARARRALPDRLPGHPLSAALRPAAGILLADAPVQDQILALEGAVRCNPNAVAILAWAREFALPSWYLGAGAITQTVWNQLHGFDPTHAIKDYDLVYFDSHDLSADNEQRIEAAIQRDLGHLGVTIDVKNEARVHLWYETAFGRPIPPYRSTEHAISTWPTTASSIGTRYEDDRFVVCAPFGLHDLFSLIVRANPTLIDRHVYESKTARWTKNWPHLSVLPWPVRPRTTSRR